MTSRTQNFQMVNDFSTESNKIEKQVTLQGGAIVHTICHGLDAVYTKRLAQDRTSVIWLWVYQSYGWPGMLRYLAL